MAPDSVRTGLVERIHREIEHHRAGRPARIRMKMNSLVDEGVIDALYLASQEGVPVQLLTRGDLRAAARACPACRRRSRCARSSGRFLEHSRVYWFDNGGEPEAWIGSADMMHRNLDRRVEVLVRLPEDQLVAEVGEMLDLAFGTDTAAWELHSDGDWVRNGGATSPTRRP